MPYYPCVPATNTTEGPVDTIDLRFQDRNIIKTAVQRLKKIGTPTRPRLMPCGKIGQYGNLLRPDRRYMRWAFLVDDQFIFLSYALSPIAATPARLLWHFSHFSSFTECMTWL